MADFKVGGKVICVDDSHKTPNTKMAPIKKGRMYILQAIRQSPCCGIMEVDIGISDNGVHCCGMCKGRTPNTDGVWWLLVSRFVPIEENDFQQVTYTKILEQVPCGAQ